MMRNSKNCCPAETDLYGSFPHQEDNDTDGGGDDKISAFE